MGKPIFLDKPLAGTLEDGRQILELAKKYNTRVFSCSSLPLTPTIPIALEKLGGEVTMGHTFGALGQAPAGDSLIWYGVHSFEMLQRLMGCGAEKVFAVDNEVSIYPQLSIPATARPGGIDPRHVDLRGRVRCGNAEFLHVDSGKLYYHLMQHIRAFFQGAPAPISMEQTFEGLAMMVAARKSIETGKWADVEKF